MKYRKKPVIVEAIQWNGSNMSEVLKFTKRHLISVDNDGLIIQTDSGTALVSLGDMIIRGTQNEIYPCKPDIFAEIYEHVDE